LLISDQKPCKNSWKLKDIWLKNKDKQLMVKEEDATLCFKLNRMKLNNWKSLWLLRVSFVTNIKSELKSWPCGLAKVRLCHAWEHSKSKASWHWSNIEIGKSIQSWFLLMYKGKKIKNKPDWYSLLGKNSIKLGKYRRIRKIFRSRSKWKFSKSVQVMLKRFRCLELSLRSLLDKSNKVILSKLTCKITWRKLSWEEFALLIMRLWIF